MMATSQQESKALSKLTAEVNAIATSGCDLNELLQRVCQSLVDHLDVAFARVWTLNEAEQMLELRASAGLYTHIDGPHGRVPVGKFKIGLIAAERLPHLTNDVLNDPRVSNQQWATQEGMIAFAGHPLLVEDRLVGVMAMFSRHKLSEFTLTMLGAIADTVALAIHRKLLEEILKTTQLWRETQAELRLRTSQLAVVTDAMTDFVEHQDFRRASRMLIAEAIAQTGSQYGFIGAVLSGPTGSEYRIFADDGIEQIVGSDSYERLKSEYSERGYLRLPELDSTISLVVQSSKLMTDHSQTIGFSLANSDLTLRNFLAVPIKQLDKVVGVFLIANNQAGYSTEQKSIEVLSQAARVIFDSYQRKLLLDEAARQLESSRLALAAANEDLRQRNEQLTIVNSDLQQFAYVASHDLREPLRAVAGFLNLLDKHYSDKLNDEAREWIGYSVDAAKRMQSLVSDLLNYSRIDRGKQFEETDFNEVVNVVISDLRVSLDESGADIQVASRLPVIARADATQMRQVFQNLIDNAIKFRAPDRKPVVTVSAAEDGSHWIFTIRDNGIGFDMQHSERIFWMFQRLHTRDEYPGNGIGLSICKRIVERHKGSISVHSAPGDGTRFVFTVSKNL
jgi:signal transduction histidine kinase